MDRCEQLYKGFLSRFSSTPTPCQDGFFHDVASFVTCDDSDILVVNGYAGTGKTTAISAVISYLRSLRVPSILLAPTGRAAKVLSSMSKLPASTIHKRIYRQKTVGSDGYGQLGIRSAVLGKKSA